MKFPFWLIPILISTIMIAIMSLRKEEEASATNKRLILFVTIGLIGLIISIGLLIILG